MLPVGRERLKEPGASGAAIEFSGERGIYGLLFPFDLFRGVKEMMVGWKRIANIALPLIVLGDMVLYNYCSSSCSFLKGSVAGIDMKYIGLIIPLPLIALALLKQDLLYLAALSFGIGGEIKLISFQIGSNVFCPYCLTAAAIIVLLFLLNFRRSRTILAASSWPASMPSGGANGISA